MSRFRKKPVEVEAIRWEGGDYACLERFCGNNWARADARDVVWGPPDDKEQVVVWNALEHQWLCTPVGHWIIRGIAGELYPCDPEVFERTYEPAAMRRVSEKASVPEGYVLAPKKPTPEMSDAGWMVERDQNTAWRLICHEVWRAMLSAAPLPPSQKGEG